MKHIFQYSILALSLLFSFSAMAQTPHQVINSAGQDRVSPSLSLTLTDNVGEVFVQTVNGGTNTITHFSICTTASGAGQILYSGALSSSLAVSNNIPPQFGVGELVVTED